MTGEILDEIKEQYNIGKKLGEGAFGKVFMITSKINHQKYALKCVKMVGDGEESKDRKNRQVELELLRNEGQILRNLKHENIVRVVKIVSSPHDQYFWQTNIVMEYADQGTLETNMPNSAYQMYKCIKQLANGLDYLHKNGIMHRDIKPANILCFGSIPIYKLGDFGLAKNMVTSVGNPLSFYQYASTIAGTPIYMAPEFFSHEQYTNKVDMWALGCVIVYLCNNGQHLFQSIEQVKQWRNVNIPVRNGYEGDNAICDIVKGLLQRDHKRRISAEDLLRKIPAS